jgi:hypothetical protein
MTQEDRLSFPSPEQLEWISEAVRALLITEAHTRGNLGLIFVPLRCLITGSSSHSALFVAWWQAARQP